VQNEDSAGVSMPDQLVYNKEKNAFFWRTDLLASEPYWLGWYEGLTEMFLKLRMAKMLVIAQVDRLDKAMTIAQMQGKIQVSLVDSVGHVIHEDKPAVVATELLQFISRNRFSDIAALNAKLAFKKAQNLPASAPTNQKSI
jgi:protein phosphatase methylesterase 1